MFSFFYFFLDRFIGLQSKPRRKHGKKEGKRGMNLRRSNKGKCRVPIKIIKQRKFLNRIRFLSLVTCVGPLFKALFMLYSPKKASIEPYVCTFLFLWFNCFLLFLLSFKKIRSVLIDIFVISFNLPSQYNKKKRRKRNEKILTI